METVVELVKILLPILAAIGGAASFVISYKSRKRLSDVDAYAKSQDVITGLLGDVEQARLISEQLFTKINQGQASYIELKESLLVYKNECQENLAKLDARIRESEKHKTSLEKQVEDLTKRVKILEEENARLLAEKNQLKAEVEKLKS